VPAEGIHERGRTWRRLFKERLVKERLVEDNKREPSSVRQKDRFPFALGKKMTEEIVKSKSRIFKIDGCGVSVGALQYAPDAQGEGFNKCRHHAYQALSSLLRAPHLRFDEKPSACSGFRACLGIRNATRL